MACLPADAALLRIFLGESDRHDGKPLYEAIVLAARQYGLAGATVLIVARRRSQRNAS